MKSKENGVLLAEASQRRSPNQDSRPAGCTVDLLVIHNISLPPKQFGGPWIDDLFHNQLNPAEHPYFAGIFNCRVSSHLLIRRDGELLQYVPLCQRAWHAGESCFQGSKACNDFSIGIELEGTDDTPYTDEQYQKLVVTTKNIMSLYPSITRERITGHSDIAPGRKTDPGPVFDWNRYLGELS
ncbi:MAG: 1,6-anhydro-N-acetylmuramyl-L-alanine amidase AmpD [Gammaproteobacteria bacterium]|nr:1,6-anhydro-N-acetylmuramyl-L-alanine amidase AmpD [Gammaproteobacteria bacterium]